MTERPSPDLPDQTTEDRRIETFVDNGGSYYLARQRYGDEIEPELNLAPESDLVKKYGDRLPQPRFSRRGGRSHPEPSDSELDPHWPADEAPFTPEELITRNEGLARARSVIDEINTKNALERAGGDEKLAQLFIRAQQDQRARERGDNEHPQAS